MRMMTGVIGAALLLAGAADAQTRISYANDWRWE